MKTKIKNFFHYFISGEVVTFVCQRDKCPNTGNAGAVKVCYDHCVSIRYATESPLPLYLCIECGNEIHRENPDVTYKDLLHPMQQVSMICENKNCRSTDKSAFSICFSNECTRELFFPRGSSLWLGKRAPVIYFFNVD